MKSSFVLILLFFFLSCENRINPGTPSPPANVDLSTSFYYEINLNNRSNFTFKVRMYVDHLTEANSIFQFAATAPGIYSIADFGRYVSDFKAFDESYNELSVSHPSVNQWQISNPERARAIEFEIGDTFHHSQPAHNILASAVGSCISADYVLLNPVAVLGYPTGLKERDFYLNIDMPPGWMTGTSLPKTENGYYAPSYDFLTDGPLLLGNLTVASAVVDGTQFNVYAHSATGKVDAGQVTSYSSQGWQDASKFLKVLPLEQYNYLYVWGENNYEDALEHSSSSVHVEGESFSNLFSILRSRSLHEFFHIITPKTIHSEVIGNFDFNVPTPSEHLWWYEGVTVWAAQTMQYRNGSIKLREWFNGFGGYGRQVSLSSVGLNCYNASDQEAYLKGALVAAMLDIRLLELSHGTKGLRELILELFAKYRHQSFPENSFNDVLTEMTYPEIGDFLNRYVKGTEDLPTDEYFNKIGVDYRTQKVIENRSANQEMLFSRWSVNF